MRPAESPLAGRRQGTWGDSPINRAPLNRPTARRIERTETRRKREHQIKLSRLWNDESISPSLLRVTVNYFIIGFIGFVAILFGFISQYPSEPLLDDWPTYGWLFLLSDVIMMLLVPIGLSIWSERFLIIVLVLVILATLIDVYAIVVNIVWIAYYFSGTLSLKAQNHQALWATLAFSIIYLPNLFLHIISIPPLIHAKMILPALKTSYNLGRFDDEGNYVDNEEPPS